MLTSPTSLPSVVTGRCRLRLRVISAMTLWRLSSGAHTGTFREAAFRDYLERRMKQPRFANGRSVRNALERARLRQATRIVRENSKKLSKTDLMRIEAEDILASRVFDDDSDEAPSDNGSESDEKSG